MDPTGNFYNYRTALRGAAHRSQTANSNRERVGLCTTSLSSLHSESMLASIHSLILHSLPACLLSSDCDSFLQSADQRHLLPEWRLCQSAAQWPRQLWGEPVPFFPGPVSFDHPKNHLFSVILFLRNLWSWHGRLGSSWHGNRWSVHLRRIGPSYTTSTLLPSSARTVRETFLHMSKYLFVIVCYPLHLFPTISFSQSSPGLYLASYESESPENQVEKDRWKALRSE